MAEQRLQASRLPQRPPGLLSAGKFGTPRLSRRCPVVLNATSPGTNSPGLSFSDEPLDATAIEAMLRQFRVVDLTSEEVRPDVLVDALSPENAVEQALGLKVARSGARRNLAARVYWQMPNSPLTMVRLYTLDP